MDINEFLRDFLKKKYFKNNIVAHFTASARKGQSCDFPSEMETSLIFLLKQMGLHKLYSHQYKAFQSASGGSNLVVSTGVASGKSLCYILPMVNEYIKNRESCGLMLFPTKALTQDQMQSFQNFISQLGSDDRISKTGIYDGDTSGEIRQRIRQRANFVLTNPDMLHLGILPHHTKWARFFRNLKYIVIDEVHIYRGIFGSHFCNVLRRLKRIAEYYGAKPQFILTSATLYRVKDFISRLLEEEFDLICENGAPAGERHFIFYNPPVIDSEMGLRKSSLQESVLLANKFLEKKLQTLVFAHTRRKVELILSYLKQNRKGSNNIFGYRSGYLAEERRSIEKRFKQAEINVLIATNAMELGIDIGSLDAVIINGYPGSISSTKQQSGRAGRKGVSSLTIFVATSNLIDQFFLQHPEFLYDSNPEEALLDPNNPYILLNHLKCALFEKPFSSWETYGDLSKQQLAEFLNLLKKYGMLRETGGKMYWKGDSYPAESISLRAAGASGYVLKAAGNVIGTVDENSAFWMAHPEAVYLHGGESFFVENLDRDKHIAELIPLKTDYYTQSQITTDFNLIELEKKEEKSRIVKFAGDLQVISQVTGFKKMKWFTNEILGYGEVNLPPVDYCTSGFWFSLNQDLVEQLIEKKIWNNTNKKYGSDWKLIAEKIRQRDGNICRECGLKGNDTKKLDVHHKIPLRQFDNLDEANLPDNLVTLCSSCHKKIESKYYIQSGLAGLTYLLLHLSPVFLMCDKTDIRAHFEVRSKLADDAPAVIFYDSIPGGIGLANKLFIIIQQVLVKASELVKNCSCKDGCPACTGPVAEYGAGAKKSVESILDLLLAEA